MNNELVLQILGATSIVSVLALLSACYAFLPNLSVEEVRDKGPHNFESRLRIKNVGRLPAFNVVADVSGMNLRMGGLNIQDMNMSDCGVPISKLAAGETTEFPVVPHVGMPVATNLQNCEYDLTLKYQIRLPLVRKTLEKRWHVELRNAGNEFTWQVAMR